MSNSISKFLDHTDRNFTKLMLAGGVIMLLITGWAWWHFSYLSAQNVFWGAVGNNLAISGVSRETLSTGNPNTIRQNDQIMLGAQNLVHTTSAISQAQPGTDKKNVVTTESIGTPDTNFSRYTAVKTEQKNPQGQPFDFSKVLNVWSKQTVGDQANGSFAQSIYDIMPFSDLNANQRNQVVNQMKRDGIYNVDFAAVSKNRVNGQLYYDYTVSVAPDKYLSILKLVDSLNGLNQLKNLDPAQYQGSQPVQVVIGVNARAHQVSRVTFTGGNRVLNYYAYGAHPFVVVPNNTISSIELQAKFGNILSGQ